MPEKLLDRLDQQIQFILEIDKLKQIMRRSYLSDQSRRENDAEHSWHLAIMAILLKDYCSDPDIDISRVLKMVLIHDLVEIDAGDTFLYDSAGAEAKMEKEQAAADRIFGLLPSDQALEMRSIWDEFESGVSTEAKFAHALDRLHPIIMINNTQGRTWKEHGVTADKALALNPTIISRGAPRLGEYAEELLLKAKELGYFFNSERKDL